MLERESDNAINQVLIVCFNEMAAQSTGTVESLQREIRPPHLSNKYSGYDTEPIDGEAPIMKL